MLPALSIWGYFEVVEGLGSKRTINFYMTGHLLEETNRRFPMRFIKIKEVTNKTGLGRSTVYKFIADGKFPKSISLGDRAVAWVEEEVTEWMETRLAERNNTL